MSREKDSYQNNIVDNLLKMTQFQQVADLLQKKRENIIHGPEEALEDNLSLQIMVSERVDGLRKVIESELRHWRSLS